MSFVDQTSGFRLRSIRSIRKIEPFGGVVELSSTESNMPKAADASSRRLALVRSCFVLYTLVLITATHWPGLAIKGPFTRTDLVIHINAFGLWTLLLGSTQWIRSSCCLRRQALMVGLIGIGFGWLDETTQPIFSRVFDWLDVAADMTGAILASLLLLLIWLRHNNWSCQIPDDSVDSLAQPPADTRS